MNPQFKFGDKVQFIGGTSWEGQTGTILRSRWNEFGKKFLYGIAVGPLVVWAAEEELVEELVMENV